MKIFVCWFKDSNNNKKINQSNRLLQPRNNNKNNNNRGESLKAYKSHINAHRICYRLLYISIFIYKASNFNCLKTKRKEHQIYIIIIVFVPVLSH